MTEPAPGAPRSATAAASSRSGRSPRPVPAGPAAPRAPDGSAPPPVPAPAPRAPRPVPARAPRPRRSHLPQRGHPRALPAQRARGRMARGPLGPDGGSRVGPSVRASVRPPPAGPCAAAAAAARSDRARARRSGGPQAPAHWRPGRPARRGAAAAAAHGGGPPGRAGAARGPGPRPRPPSRPARERAPPGPPTVARGAAGHAGTQAPGARPAGPPASGCWERREVTRGSDTHPNTRAGAAGSGPERATRGAFARGTRAQGSASSTRTRSPRQPVCAPRAGSGAAAPPIQLLLRGPRPSLPLVPRVCFPVEERGPHGVPGPGSRALLVTKRSPEAAGRQPADHTGKGGSKEN